MILIPISYTILQLRMLLFYLQNDLAYLDYDYTDDRSLVIIQATEVAWQGCRNQTLKSESHKLESLIEQNHVFNLWR